MENEQRKEKLISLIKKFNNTCSECGKLFLGALVEGSTEIGAYPVDVGIYSYPLSCGKCPECAKKCYENLYEYVDRNNKIPCDDDIIDEDENIKDILVELDCWMYLDEDFQMDQLGAGNPNVQGGELIDLFEFFKEELISVNAEKVYNRKQQLIENLEKQNTIQNSETLLEFLKDEDPRVRVKALEILGNKDDSQIIENLLNLLKDKDSGVRVKALEILGNKDDSQIIDKLLELLKDKDSRVRGKLVEILGKQDNPQILQNLLELLNDESYHVRNTIIEVFRNIENSQIIQKLFDLLKEENKKISKNVEKIIERNNTLEVITKLIDILKSEIDKDWEKALEILSKKKSSKYLIDNLNVIINNIFDKLNFEEKVHIKNFEAFLKIDKSASFEFLVEKYKNETSKNQLKILDLMGRIGNEKDIKQIIQELQIYERLITILKNKDNKKEIRLIALRLLNYLISETNVLKLFVDILTDEQENNHLIKNIEESLGKFISLKEQNLLYILNYTINQYHTFSNKSKRIIRKLFLNYEREWIINKNFEQKKDLIEILFNLLKENENQKNAQEAIPENLLRFEENLNVIYNKIGEGIIENFPFHYIILILAILRKKIGKEEYIKRISSKFRYELRRKFKHDFVLKSFSSFIKTFGALEIKSYLKNDIDSIMKDIYKLF